MIRTPMVMMVVMIATTAYAQEAGIPDEVRMLGNCGGCSFGNADLSERKLTGIILEQSELNDVNFSGAQLNIAVFNGAVLSDVNFADADLRGASFTDATLIDVSFEGADLLGAVFDGATLENTDLQTALLCDTQMPDDSMEHSGCN